MAEGDGGAVGIESTITHAGDASAASPEGLSAGTLVDRYVVLDRIGSGAMGVVYAAYDTRLERKVALKLLRRADNPEVEARLLREARTLAQLAHPHVVVAHDVGRAGARLFIAMEFVEGTTLRAYVIGRSWREILAAFVAAGRGLAAAHAAGLVHRDFKPDNVLVGKDGRARVADFGLARAAADVATASGAAGDAEAIVGTPGYMPPEQIHGEPSDARSDQFSFCVALHEALYGTRPFEGVTLRERAEQILAGRVARPPASAVPPRVFAAIRRGLSAKREERWPDMNALLATLEPDPPSRKRRLAIAVVAVAIAAAVPFTVSRVQKAELQRCAVAGGRLAATWNGARRDAVARAFAAVHRADGAAALAAVEAAVDGYVALWSGTRGQICHAPASSTSGELRDLELSCLDRRLDELDTLAGLLSRADAPLVERGAQSVTGLSNVEACTAVTALRSPVPVPAGLRRPVEALRRRLATVRATSSAGHRADALRLATAVTRDAQTLGYAPVTAEALFEQARVEDRATPQKSAALLRDAIHAAEAGRHVALAVESWAHLGFVVGHELLAFEDGRECLRHATSLLGGLGGDERLEALILRARGNVSDRSGKLVDAVADLQRALALREHTLGPDNPEVGEIVAALGRVQIDRGHFDEALALERRAQAILERVQGPRHDTVARALLAQGSALESLHRYDEARAIDERALAIFEGNEGKDHPTSAVALMNLAIVFNDLGQYAHAAELHRRVLAIYEKAYGSESAQAAEAMVNLGGALWKQGQKPAAVALFERALAVREKVMGRDNPDLYTFVLDVGGSLRKDDPKRAIPYLERALALAQKAFGPDDPNSASTLSELGQALVDAHELERARPLLERAVRILTAAKSPALPGAQFALAEVTWPRDHAEARRLMHLVRDAVANDPMQAADLRETDDWLRRH